MPILKVVYICVLLCAAPYAADSAGDTPRDDALALRQVALTSTDAQAVTDAILSLARADDDAAMVAMKNILHDESRIKLLLTLIRRTTESTSDSGNSIWDSKTYLERVLFSVLSDMPTKGEALLLQELKAVPDKTQSVNFARIRAFGFLIQPSDAVYTELSNIAKDNTNVLNGTALAALLHIGTRRAKDILLQTLPDESNSYLNAQFSRQKPPMFELLIEGYRRFPKSGDGFISAILSNNFAVKLPPSTRLKLPSYDTFATSVESTKSAIDDLLKNPGKRPLTDAEKTGLLAFRKKLDNAKSTAK